MGLPCVAGVCLGDGLAELSQIPWVQNPYYQPNLAKDMIALGKAVNGFDYSGFTSELAFPLLFAPVTDFDGRTIGLLGSVTAACNQSTYAGPVGRFTSPAGTTVQVMLQLLPNVFQPDFSKQQWAVGRIRVQYPSAKTDAQFKDIELQLRDRYQKFDKLRVNERVNVRFKNFIQGSYAELALEFDKTFQQNIFQHPLCGGANKIKVD